MKMKLNLNSLEARLGSLIEGSAARLFRDPRQERDLAHQLVQAMQANTHRDAEGNLIAPNLFRIHAHPSQAPLLAGQPALLEGLSQALQEAGKQADYVFSTPPVIHACPDDGLGPAEFYVEAVLSQDGLGTTSMLPASLPEAAREPTIPRDAYLIVDGTRVFPLLRSPVNIGRRPDNHLVIDDGRISRLHAQLRAANGRFTIFDLDSSGGTWVNGQRIQQWSLRPGDVISLAGLPLVYGQDSAETGETQIIQPNL